LAVAVTLVAVHYQQAETTASLQALLLMAVAEPVLVLLAQVQVAVAATKKTQVLAQPIKDMQEVMVLQPIRHLAQAAAVVLGLPHQT
jgi:hypothetical protein